MKVDIRRSTNSNKKLMAIFNDDSGKKIKTVHFGASGMSDYTKHKDDERKKLYLARHKKNEDWNNYMTPGSLSRWVLWEYKSLHEAIRKYKQKFNLL